MSEPLSSKDIEDVVSSVRRLISPDARPRPVSRDLGVDRLILTSSLRIVADPAATSPAVVMLDPAPKKRAAPRRAKTRHLSTPVLTDVGGEILPANDPVVSEASGLGLTELALTVEPAELVSEAVVESVETVAEVAMEPVAAAAPRRKARKAAKAAEPAPKPKRTKAGKAAPVAEKPARRASRRKAEAPVVEAVAEAPVETLVAEPVAEPAMEETVAQAPLAEGVAEAVEALAETETAGADPVAEEPVVDTPETVKGEVVTDAAGNPVSLLDEDQLVELLRRVIREELQGTLGEKITRNVRKLVRAEIARAMTMDTLE